MQQLDICCYPSLIFRSLLNMKFNLKVYPSDTIQYIKSKVLDEFSRLKNVDFYGLNKQLFSVKIDQNVIENENVQISTITRPKVFKFMLRENNLIPYIDEVLFNVTNKLFLNTVTEKDIELVSDAFAIGVQDLRNNNRLTNKYNFENYEGNDVVPEFTVTNTNRCTLSLISSYINEIIKYINRQNVNNILENYCKPTSDPKIKIINNLIETLIESVVFMTFIIDKTKIYKISSILRLVCLPIIKFFDKLYQVKDKFEIIDTLLNKYFCSNNKCEAYKLTELDLLSIDHILINDGLIQLFKPVFNLFLNVFKNYDFRQIEFLIFKDIVSDNFIATLQLVILRCFYKMNTTTFLKLIDIEPLLQAYLICIMGTPLNPIIRFNDIIQVKKIFCPFIFLSSLLINNTIMNKNLIQTSDHNCLLIKFISYLSQTPVRIFYCSEKKVETKLIEIIYPYIAPCWRIFSNIYYNFVFACNNNDIPYVSILYKSLELIRINILQKFIIQQQEQIINTPNQQVNEVYNTNGNQVIDITQPNVPPQELQANDLPY